MVSHPYRIQLADSGEPHYCMGTVTLELYRQPRFFEQWRYPTGSGPPYKQTTYKATLLLTSFTEKSISQLQHSNFPRDIHIHRMFGRHSTNGVDTLKLLICLALVCFLPMAMGDLLIQSTVKPYPLIGANSSDVSAVKYVVTDGDINQVGPLVVVQRRRRLFKSQSQLCFLCLYDGRMSADCCLVLFQWYGRGDDKGVKLSLNHSLYATKQGNKVVVQSMDSGTRWKVTCPLFKYCL